jgi:hypothetical protein
MIAINSIWLYSCGFDQQYNIEPMTPSPRGHPNPTIFLWGGFIIRLGRARRSQNNYLLYNAFDLINS